jgi:RNA ligase
MLIGQVFLNQLMTSIFPVIKKLEEISNVTKDDPQWKIKLKDDFYFCSYRQGSSDFFPNPETAKKEERTKFLLFREIRGLVFDAKSHQILSRPFQKFFNINENNETNENNLKIDKKFWILEKLDGSMCQPLLKPTKDSFILKFSTKMGFDSPITKHIEHFLYQQEEEEEYPLIKLNGSDFSYESKEKVKEGYLKFCVSWMSKGYTPIFEFCSPKCKIVIDYEKEMLILLAIRHNETGEYISYDELKEIVKEFDVQLVNEIYIDKIESMKDITNHIKKLKNREG